jgi:hypothetical protein
LPQASFLNGKVSEQGWFLKTGGYPVTDAQKPNDKLSNISSRLRTLAQGRDTVDIAQFRMMELDDIRAAYGDRWPENKDRILSVADGFLRRRMDPGDLLIQAGDGFIMVFGSTSGSAAVSAAGSLTHGLNEFFLGESGENPVPRMGATSLPVQVSKLEATLAQIDFVDPPPPPQANDAGRLDNIDWRYQAVWDVRRETLSSWYVVPYSRKTHERLPGYYFESASMTAAQTAAIDEASLMMSEQALSDLIPAGRLMLIGCSVHLTTLTNLATRAKLMATIDRLNQSFLRYRLVKIAGVAPGVPRLYLNEIVNVLKAKIPNIIIGCAWNEPDFAGILQTGPAAVGVTLTKSVIGPAAAVPLQTLMTKLISDANLAHAAHKRFFVEGQFERDVAVRLAAAPIDNIISPRVWPAQSGMPMGMIKWPLSKLAA